MRLFRFLIVSACPVALVAQPAESDQKVLQTLVSEVQQLRMSIERSTLLGARAQLAASELQLQGTEVGRLTQQLNEARQAKFTLSSQVSKMAEQIKELEQLRSAPEYSPPQRRDALEAQIKQMKLEMDETSTNEQNRSAQESEVASALQAAQKELTDLRGRMAEMEKALDTAIEQMMKPH